MRVFHFDRHYGRLSAVDAGFKHSVGALVITIDGDLQNDPARRAPDYKSANTNQYRSGCAPFLPRDEFGMLKEQRQLCVSERIPWLSVLAGDPVVDE